MELKQLTAEQIAQLEAPLPKEAVKPHPSKPYLSTIKGIFVTERLNQVFGLGKWQTDSIVLNRGTAKNGKFTATVDLHMEIPEYGMKFQSYGGSDNDDEGDALKGANTDAITKIAAVHLHVGVSVYKGLGSDQSPPRARDVTPPVKVNQTTGEVEPSPDEIAALFDGAVVSHEATKEEPLQRCPVCGEGMFYKEWIAQSGKNIGNQMRAWKCNDQTNCRKTLFING